MTTRETFPEYLRRVAADHTDSGHEYTAKDYEEAALRLSGAAVALRAIAAIAKTTGGRPEAVRIVEIACNTANNIDAHP